MLRITKYFDKLIDGMDDIYLTDSTKNQLSAWSCKSEGANVWFKVDGTDEEIEVYATLPDTFFEETFVVLAQEHPLFDKFVLTALKNDAQKYIEFSKQKSVLELSDLAKIKTGIPTGALTINPANGKKIKTWMAD